MWVYPTLVHGYRHFAATTKEKGATLSRNPLFYLVELAGVEPASEIPTSSVLHA